MNKDDAKVILESYRAQDADDPIFAEALKMVAEDPELAEWFEEMQRFDAVMAAKFNEIHVSTDLKDQILSGKHPAATILSFPPWRIVASVGAIAALVCLSLFSWHLLAPPVSPLDQLELQAVAYSDKMPPLQFVCFNAAAVADWINKQPGSAKVGLRLPPPPKSLSMAMIGSSMIQWNGHPVVMVCLQNDKRMAMLYIMKCSDFPGVKEGLRDTMQKADWIVRSSTDNGQVHLLATKGGPNDLDFQMPF